MTPVLVVAGVDPGLARTGYGIIRGRPDAWELVASGTIETRAGRPVHERLLELHGALTAVLGEFRPDLVAVEQLFVNRNLRSATSVGEARGVVLLAAAQAGARVAEYPPHAIKLAVTGQGRGAKEQVAYMVRQLLRVRRPLAPDEADALAVALCAAQLAHAPAV